MVTCEIEKSFAKVMQKIVLYLTCNHVRVAKLFAAIDFLFLFQTRLHWKLFYTVTGDSGLAVRVDGSWSVDVLVVHGCLAGRHVRHHHPGTDALRRPRPDIHRPLTSRTRRHTNQWRHDNLCACVCMCGVDWKRPLLGFCCNYEQLC